MSFEEILNTHQLQKILNVIETWQIHNRRVQHSIKLIIQNRQPSEFIYHVYAQTADEVVKIVMGNCVNFIKIVD
jgi:hypothetical protein